MICVDANPFGGVHGLTIQSLLKFPAEDDLKELGSAVLRECNLVESISRSESD